MKRSKQRILLFTIAAAVLGACLTFPIAATAQSFAVKRVAADLMRPVFLTAPPGDSSRVFIVEQHTGQIRILRRNTWTLDPTPFLTISGVSTGSEQGLRASQSVAGELRSPDR